MIWNRNKIDKKKRIQEWIDWVEIPVIIKIPDWGEKIPRGVFHDKRNIIVIDGSQSEKEIIKSIIHEVSHWKNNDKVEDPDIWEREQRAKDQEKDWEKEPNEVIWK
jgi:hypothetical protein